jgi:hypothetical protein
MTVRSSGSGVQLHVILRKNSIEIRDRLHVPPVLLSRIPNIYCRRVPRSSLDLLEKRTISSQPGD